MVFAAASGAAYAEEFTDLRILKAADANGAMVQIVVPEVQAPEMAQESLANLYQTWINDKFTYLKDKKLVEQKMHELLVRSSDKAELGKIKRLLKAESSRLSRDSEESAGLSGSLVSGVAEAQTWIIAAEIGRVNKRLAVLNKMS